MQGTTQNYTLDMVDERKKEPLRVKQYDTNSRWARISLTAFGEPWSIPVGSRGYISIKKVDGNTVLNDCTIEGKNQVLAPISEQTTAVPGIQQAELYFLAVDGDIKSQTFPINVYPAIMDQRGIESSNEFGTLQTAIIGAQEATRTAQDAAAEAMVQAGEARDAAEIAMDAAASLDVAVQAAEAAKTSETNAKASETAAAQYKTDVEAMKTAFASYNKVESGRKYANALTTTAEGEGQVVVKDAWEAPVVNLEVDGASEQVVTTGAQLLDLTKAKGGTSAGITIVVNKDGSYTCSGTATEGNINVWFLGNYGEQNQSLFTLKSGTYYKSGICLFNGYQTIGPVYDGKFTLAEDTPITCVRALQLESGKTYNGVTVYPMLNAGDTAIPWEPYTGGKPSPSPDYPQEIVSVAHVANSGAQLLDYLSLPSATVNGVTFTPRADGTVSAVGLATDVSAFDLFESELPPGTYCISGCPTGATMETYQIIAYKKASGVFTILGTDTGDGAVFNVVQGENIVIRIVLRKGTSGPIVFRPMLNAGPTPLPWEPYNGQQREIDLEVESRGANLFDIDNATFSTNAITDNGFIKINNGIKFTVSSNANFGGLYSFDIPKESGYYNMSCDIIVSSKDFNSIKVGFEGHLTKQVVPGDFTGNKAHFEMAGEISNQKALVLYVDNMGKTPGVTVEFANIMIAKGDTVFPWEPYTGYQKVTIPLTEPLRGIGDVKDRFCLRSDVWGIERKFGVQIFDGSADERWMAVLNTDGINYRNGTSFIKAKSKANGATLCTTFAKKDGVTNSLPGFKVAGDASIITYSEAYNTSDVSLWTAYLAENPMTIVYELATPTWEPFPEDIQAAINALFTHPGATYLTVTSTDVAAPIRLEYVQDTRKVIDGLKLDVAEQMIELQAQIDQLKVTNNLS